MKVILFILLLLVQLLTCFCCAEYIVEDICFRFSRDWKNFYGGDQFSAKIADHELLSIRSVLELEMPGIYTPMMALIDYCGYRITATPLLPINQRPLGKKINKLN